MIYGIMNDEGSDEGERGAESKEGYNTMSEDSEDDSYGSETFQEENICDEVCLRQ